MAIAPALSTTPPLTADVSLRGRQNQVPGNVSSTLSSSATEALIPDASDKKREHAEGTHPRPGGSGLPPKEAPARLHVCVLSHFSRVQLCVTVLSQPVRLLCPRDCPGKNPGVEAALLQGIFLTQGSNLRLSRLPHWLAGSLPLALPPRGKIQGSPKSVETLLLSKTEMFLKT